jgi:chromosome partitioning protein
MSTRSRPVVVGVSNQKGGAGKTALAVNLAAALGERGFEVLLVDGDAQANSTSYLGLAGLSAGRGLVDVLDFKSRLSELACETAAPNVFLVPATQLLAPVWIHDFLNSKVGRDTLLRTALERDEELDFDFVVFDTAPVLSLLNVVIWAACDELLVPFEPHPHHAEGFSLLFEKVSEIQAFVNPGLKVEGLVACRVDRSNLQRELIWTVRDAYGELVYDAFVRQNIRVAESVSHAMPVTVYDPKSAGAEDFRSLASEFLRRHGIPEKRVLQETGETQDRQALAADVPSAIRGPSGR